MVKYRCTICGYIHEGELPEDYVCPLCKQPASVFEKVEEEAPLGVVLKSSFPRYFLLVTKVVGTYPGVMWVDGASTSRSGSWGRQWESPEFDGQRDAGDLRIYKEKAKHDMFSRRKTRKASQCCG